MCVCVCVWGGGYLATQSHKPCLSSDCVMGITCISELWVMASEVTSIQDCLAEFNDDIIVWF